MYQRIVILFITSVLIVMVHSDVLKCYMCTSLSREGCGSDMIYPIGKSLQPVECTGVKMLEWQKSILQHNILSQIAHLFEVDKMPQYYLSASQNMACAKMILDVANTNVTVRTCQAAKTEFFDPCKIMKGKLKQGMLGTMKQCTLCIEEACNNTISLSPGIFYILLPFFSTFLHVVLYHRA